MKLKVSMKRPSINLLAGLSTINRLLVSVLILIVIIIAIGLKLTFPQVSGLLNINRQNNDLKQKTASLEKKLNELSSYNRLEIDGLYRKVLEAVPDENYFLKQLALIKLLASENNVGIADIQVKPGLIEKNSVSQNADGKAGSLNNLVFDAKVRGNLSSLSGWVKSIETSLPLSEISKMDIDIKYSSASASINQVLEAEIQIVSYWSKLLDYLGKIDSSVAKLDKTDYDTLSLLNNYQSIPVAPLPGGDYSEYGGAVGKDNPFP